MRERIGERKSRVGEEHEREDRGKMPGTRPSNRCGASCWSVRFWGSKLERAGKERVNESVKTTNKSLRVGGETRCPFTRASLTETLLYSNMQNGGNVWVKQNTIERKKEKKPRKGRRKHSMRQRKGKDQHLWEEQQIGKGVKRHQVNVTVLMKNLKVFFGQLVAYSNHVSLFTFLFTQTHIRILPGNIHKAKKVK